MTTWLFKKHMEVEPGVFEHGPDYDINDGETVFVFDSETGVFVGEFEARPRPGLSKDGSGESRTRTSLLPRSEELLYLDNDMLPDDVTGPKLSPPVVDALNVAREVPNSGTITPDEFFGDREQEQSSGDSAPDESRPEEPDNSTDNTLQEVFTQQEGVEGADFSGQSVTGAKELSDTSLRGATLSDVTLEEGTTFRNVNLRDVDFRNAQLRDVTFTGRYTQLGGADFTGARLDSATFEVDVSGCTFTGAQMREADLREASLEAADFSEARLKRAKLHHSEPERASFNQAVMQSVKTNDAVFEKTSFVGADLSDTVFTETQFKDVDFTDADLRGTTFDDCELKDIEFVGAKMADVTLKNHETTNLNFERADLAGASLSGSSFDSARFTGARLSGADFRRCDLSGVSLADVRADGVTFDGGNLEYATLAQADLTDASFVDARLYTCQLVSARVGTETTFDGIYDYSDNETTDHHGDGTLGRKAASVYRTLESVYRENSLTDESLRYHRKRKDATLEANREEGRYFPVLIDTFLKYTTSHGTRLRPLIGSSVLFVLVTASFHFVFGTLRHETVGRLGLLIGDPSWLTSFAHSALFSFLAFTGLGYGRFTPVSSTGEGLAVAQTASGVLFFGLLVFVLSTRASR